MQFLYSQTEKNLQWPYIFPYLVYIRMLFYISLQASVNQAHFFPLTTTFF